MTPLAVWHGQVKWKKDPDYNPHLELNQGKSSLLPWLKGVITVQWVQSLGLPYPMSQVGNPINGQMAAITVISYTSTKKVGGILTAV